MTVKETKAVSVTISHNTSDVRQTKPTKDATNAAKVLNKDIDTTCKALKTVDTDIHDLTKRCILHAKTFGDTGPTVRLVQGISDAMPMYAVNVLRAYILNNSPIEFQYAETDKKREKPINAKLAKDSKGNLKVAFASEEKLDTLPISLEQSARPRNQRELKPFSVEYAKGWVARLEQGLKDAVTEQGRGIIIGSKDGQPVVSKDMKDPDTKAKYDLYLAYIRSIEATANQVTDLMAPAQKDTPTNANPKVDKAPRVIKGANKKNEAGTVVEPLKAVAA